MHLSGSGYGNDVTGYLVAGSEYESDSDSEIAVSRGPPVGNDGVRIVRNLSLDYFHGRLIEQYFDILFLRGALHSVAFSSWTPSA